MLHSVVRMQCDFHEDFIFVSFFRVAVVPCMVFLFDVLEVKSSDEGPDGLDPVQPLVHLVFR